MKSVLTLLFSVTFLSFGQINWISLGPDGGNLGKIVVDPFNPLHIIALPVESTDGGTTWFKSFQPEVIEFQFDPFQSAHRYLIATDGGLFPSNYKLFKSVNGGATWTLNLQGQAQLHGLVLDRSVNGRLFLLRGNSGSGVYTAEVLKSTDGGNSWQSIYTVRDSSGFLRPFRAVVPVPGNASRLLLLKTFGMDTSSSGGLTWHSVDTVIVNNVPRYAPNYPIVELAINPTNSSKWFARLFSDLLVDSLAFLRSTDGGIHWLSMSGVKVPRPLFIAPAPPNNATPIRFHPANPDTMFFASSVGSSFIYRTTNGGITWSRSADSLTIDEVQDIAFVDAQRGLRLSTKGLGMYKVAADISQILPSNSGIRLHASNDVSIPDRAGPLLVSASSFFKVTVSSNFGLSWQPRSSGIFTQEVVGLRISSIAPERWYAVGTGDLTPGTIFLSTNTGQTWTIASSGFDFDTLPSDSIILFRQRGGIDKSTNGGTTWTTVLNPPAGGGGRPVADPTKRWVVTHKYSAGTIFGVISANTSFSNVFQLQRSTDGGSIWNLVSLPVSPDFLNEVAGIWFDPQSPDRMYLSYNGGILCKSTDNGAIWNTITNPVAGRVFQRVFDLLVSPTNSNVLFAATTYGVYRSFNAGGSWSLLTDSSSAFSTIRLALGRNDTLFAASFNFGVYKTSRSVLTDVEQPPTPSMSFSLQQNYPNPFNPTTMIHYQLPVESNVTMKLFDVLGREVATLVNERKERGEHAVRVNASKLSTGIYFYKLQAGSFSETKKMVVVR